MVPLASSRSACVIVADVDDREVIDAFVKDGTKRAFGPTLHVEANTLLLSGWWHAALRIVDGVFVVRNEEPREPAPALDELPVALAESGLKEVVVDHPLIQPITYTDISLGQLSWALWAVDLETGVEALTVRASADSFLSDAPFTEEPVEPVSADFSAELGGARRVAGLPVSLVLTVGLEKQQAKELDVALGDCRLEARTFEEFPPSACGALIPGVIVVDATGDTGRRFIMELRTEACGRFIPVVALIEEGPLPLGADESLDPRTPPATWVATLRALLP